LGLREGFHQAKTLSSFDCRGQAAAAVELIDFESQQQLQQADEAFRAILAPLEEKVGRPLKDPGRSACLLAFAENADGFAQVAADALERGRNPLALLCKLVTDGDHRTAPPAAAKLAKALAWADSAGRLLEVDHREEILAGFHLGSDELAQVRLRLLGPVDVDSRYSNACKRCRAHPCMCEAA
jgi:hypothetical protein